MKYFILTILIILSTVVNAQEEFDDCKLPDPDGWTQGTDGEGGVLWKPEGDNTPTLVFLLPTEFCKEVDVYVVRKINTILEKLWFTGYANGNRAHYRGELKGGKYTGYVLVKRKDKKTWSWNFDKPAQRND